MAGEWGQGNEEKRTKGFSFLCLHSLALLFLAASLHAAPPRAELVSVQKVWDRAPHNGFTDLIRFRGRFFCCFREGLDHVGGDGVIRILTSFDGAQWGEVAAIHEDGVDLREAKLAVTPDGRQLYMICGGSIFGPDKKLKTRRTRFATSTDGKTWTPTKTLLAENDWLWRVTKNPADRRLYGIADNVFPTTGAPPPEEQWSLKMYSSSDGIDWQPGTTLRVPGQPNQSTLRFLQDGRAMALVRRDDGDRPSMIGVAWAPYREWQWTTIPVRIAGPNFLELPDGTLVAGSRGFGKTVAETHVVLHRMTATSLDPILKLPSAGSDCGYPGLLWHDGLLWVTYNSSHEGKTDIYLAKVRMSGAP